MAKNDGGNQRKEYRTVVQVDPFKPAEEQKGLMNRWQ